jgi:hypothetical protein
MKRKKQHIAFIYFDERYIIPHFITPVNQLFNDELFEVDILTYEGSHEYLFELLEMQNLPKTIVKQLPTYTYRKILNKIKGRKMPSPLYLFKKHKELLLSYDILVFNDINHEYLHRYKQEKSPKFVLLMHGAGDGEYLIGAQYKETISKFDLITTSGQKVTEYFQKMKLTNTQLAICGYQKFDLIKNKAIPKFFDNDKPVVLYNPHFKPELSSWYKFGEEILAFFFQNKDYNLIFAPHINLFNKKGFLDESIIDPKYKNAQNIRIDLGSKHSVNMDYTLAADIYLGDVSSQIYEFLYRPRPSIFINAHKIEWQKNQHYNNWHLGQVIDDLSSLENLLDTASDWQQNFVQKQQEMMSFTFDNSSKLSAAERIVEAIKEKLLK